MNYEQWWEQFTSERDEWRLADSEALRKAAFEAGQESLRQQLADMTKDRDRLLDVMGEIAGSKSLTAAPTQFYQHLQRIASDATITNTEALTATEPKEQGK